VLFPRACHLPRAPRVLPKDIQQVLGVPLSENIYYRDLSAAIL